MDRLELRTKFAGRIETFRLADSDIEVNLRSLSALDRAKIVDKFKILAKAQEDEKALERLTIESQCFIVARGLVNESGARIYQDDEMAAIAEEFPCKALDELSKRILEMSGMSENQSDRLKNSEPTPNAAGSSVLQ